MKIGAVICEYNPFHNGHKYHIGETKQKYGVTHMIAVMSGNFTQRGDVAILDKWSRAEIALQNGIDLVIELPVAFSLGSAEDFAMGAVTILNSLDCVDVLSFGSESGDIELLKETAGAVHYCMEQDMFFGAMRRGATFPVALQQTVAHYYDDEIMEVLTTPNNTLAIEYLKAMNETGSFIKPVTIKRYGAAHDSDKSESDTIVSASRLREMFVAGEATERLMPSVVSGEFSLLERLELPILAKLRSMTAAEIQKTPNVLHGLENRIYKAARVARNLNELLFLIKTKRYTMARIRRIVLCAFLGITKADVRLKPQYIHVLGMNEGGREIMQQIKSPLPMDTSLMKLYKSSAGARQQAILEEQCGNLYALSFEKPRPSGMDFTHKPIIL